MRSRRRQSIVACICALVAVAGVFAYTASVKSEAALARAAALERYGGERAQVLVATRDIAVGEGISSSNAQMQEWVVDLLPDADAFASVDETAGMVAQACIKKNEVLLKDRVGNGSSRISVPAGLAAVTVSSDDVLAVGGAITAGSFVDVYAETSKGTVTLLGEKIVVLETSTLEGEGEEQVTWVTLAVTPSSVSELMTASVKGTIHFSLPAPAASGQGGA